MLNFKTLAIAAVIGAAGLAHANEAQIRKNLPERFPGLPKIEEVKRSPMKNVWEVRLGDAQILYSDPTGAFIMQGSMVDAKTRRNLTEERVEKLTALSFDALPLRDAFTIVRGNGKRKVAVFEDPNCGYCKRFERDLQNVDNVTIYQFLLPILSADSTEKSKNIWCSADKSKAWLDWMVRDKVPPASDASCDSSALTRNVELSRKHRITGTPTLIFADGTRVPGAIDAAKVERYLAEAR